jgi:hypothetical protein
MKQKVKTEDVTGAGIPADSDYSPFILQDTIPVLFKARDGVSGLCINSRTCLNVITLWDVLAVADAQVAALLI